MSRNLAERQMATEDGIVSLMSLPPFGPSVDELRLALCYLGLVKKLVPGGSGSASRPAALADQSACVSSISEGYSLVIHKPFGHLAIYPCTSDANTDEEKSERWSLVLRKEFGNLARIPSTELSRQRFPEKGINAHPKSSPHSAGLLSFKRQNSSGIVAEDFAMYRGSRFIPSTPFS
jgi:hypothetical protein